SFEIAQSTMTRCLTSFTDWVRLSIFVLLPFKPRTPLPVRVTFPSAGYASEMTTFEVGGGVGGGVGVGFVPTTFVASSHPIVKIAIASTSRQQHRVDRVMAPPRV